MARLLFKFYKSYFDVANELTDKDRLAFYDAIMQRQFYGIEPDLKGIVKLAYISQKHNIDAQIKGWEDKTKEKLTDPMQGGIIGGKDAPSTQVKEKEEVKEEVKVKERVKAFNPPTLLEVQDYFFENGYTKESGLKAFNYYSVGNWKDSTGKQVKNWKQKMNAVWFKDENKIVKQQPQKVWQSPA